MRLIDADTRVTFRDYDDHYMEYTYKEMTVAEALDFATDEGCPPIIERPSGVWKYHNDEHGIWWNCSKCGKILRRPPNDKRFCSRCGAEMTREA